MQNSSSYPLDLDKWMCSKQYDVLHANKLFICLKRVTSTLTYKSYVPLFAKGLNMTN